MPSVDIQELTLDLLVALLKLPAVLLLRSRTNHNTLRNDLISAISSGIFDLDRIKPLLNAILTDKPDSQIWYEVYNAVVESTPPPRSVASFLHQTLWIHNTSNFVNSSEHRKYMDSVLKEELGLIYVGLRDFHEKYFGDVADLKIASQTFFEHCMEGSDPLFDNGWRGWPNDAKQDSVLSWFADFCEKLAVFAESYKPSSTRQRRPLAQPDEWIDGSIAKRKMDVGFVNNTNAKLDSRCHWSEILVPGELKSNPLADRASDAWLDLPSSRLVANDTLRFSETVFQSALSSTK